MSLFETTAPVEELSARRAAHLPAPTKSRFAPLRAGILNVWEYDDQQFWFADGRLLLRGRNETGKSKVLELLFPFVLDGDITPKKLDPFDTANKSMWWNLIGFNQDRSSAIGYLWLEFGRLDESASAEYLTAIVGVQATRAERRVATWFALTPQRVDLDLDLAPGEVCRPQDSLSKALVTGACFETKASAHRANVATRLFAMSPERFANLLHLLRQLRKPKLADKLDNKKLSEVLTNALPPLDEARIEPLATGFSFLDGDISDLARAEDAHRATGTFLDIYRTYSRGQARHRANQVVSAVTNFDNVTRAEGEARRSLERAQGESRRLSKELTDLAHQLAIASGSLRGLDLSAVESLRALEQKKDADERVAEGAWGEATRALTAADTAAARATDVDGVLAERQQKESAALSGARRAAGKAGIESVWEATSVGVGAAAGLLGAVRSRRALLEAVAAAEGRAARARERLAISQSKVDQAAERVAECADASTQAVERAGAARDDFVAAVDIWLRASPAPLNVAAETVGEKVGAGDWGARRVAAAYSAEGLGAADEALQSATEDVANARTRRDQAATDLEAHDALPDETPPPRRAGIPKQRSGMPLWLAVEFTDGVDFEEAALLEAALDAAGILDAVITTEGLIDADDTVIVAADSASRGIRDWLRPADGTETGVVNGVLGAIGAGAGSTAVCWVDLDGAWCNGPLQGRWTKSAAEHIGAGARAATRLRQRAELAAVLDEAEDTLSSAQGAFVEAQDRRRAVLAWRDDFPSASDWAVAERDVVDAEKQEARAARQHREAVEAHAGEVAANKGALDAVETAVLAAGCQPAEVPSLRLLLDAAGDAAQDLRAAANDTAGTLEHARRMHEDTNLLRLEAESAESRHQEAALAASSSLGAYRTVFELQGADVRRVLAEKDRLEGQVKNLTDSQHRTQANRDSAREAEIRAEGVLEETGRRRAAASTERDQALTALAVLVRSGHVSHTVVVDAARDAADYVQPTAGRTLARQIAAAVPADEGAEDARSRATDRLVAAFTPLRDAIGTAFDPHLDSTEVGVFSASATLNGEVVGIADLHQALADDVEQRRATIAAAERNLIEQYLRDEVGNHLGDCLHAATTQVQQMNAILKRHPTNSGATVQLRWQVSDAAGPGVKDAVQALLRSPATRGEQESATLAVFLSERVAMARRGDVDGADLAERLTATLDYRTWYTFGVSYRAGGEEAALTARSVGSGSGGQQAKVAHLPLLAAAAGFYSSSPSAPRLCILDEAFAGIDGPNTADLLTVATTLDLDMVMTNFDAWFCVPQLPGLAIYHLEKLSGAVGVAAIRYEWDGHTQSETDPWLDR